MDISVYHCNEDLPIEYQHQIRTVVRWLWHDVYVYDLDAPLVPPHRHPQHVVLSNRHALISYARVVWVDVEHAGWAMKMYCLGDVFTFPEFRKKGYGHQVVQTATDLIRADSNADCAILFTDPSLEGFYGANGWEHIAGFRCTIGEAQNPEPYEGFAMMLFLSAKAQAARQAFETQSVYLPGYGW